MEYSPQIQRVVDWYRQPLFNPIIKDKMRKISNDENKFKLCDATRVKLIGWLSHLL